MTAALKAREIDAAWRRHRPESVSIPAEARRKVRLLKGSLAGDAGKIKAAYETAPVRDLLTGYLRKGAIGRERSLLRIKAALAPAASVDADGGGLS